MSGKICQRKRAHIQTRALELKPIMPQIFNYSQNFFKHIVCTVYPKTRCYTDVAFSMQFDNILLGFFSNKYKPLSSKMKSFFSFAVYGQTGY